MDSALPGMHYRPSEMRRHSLLFIETCLGSRQSSETASCQLKVSPGGLRPLGWSHRAVSLTTGETPDTSR